MPSSSCYPIIDHFDSPNNAIHLIRMPIANQMQTERRKWFEICQFCHRSTVVEVNADLRFQWQKTNGANENRETQIVPCVNLATRTPTSVERMKKRKRRRKHQQLTTEHKSNLHIIEIGVQLKHLYARARASRPSLLRAHSSQNKKQTKKWEKTKTNLHLFFPHARTAHKVRITRGSCVGVTQKIEKQIAKRTIEQRMAPMESNRIRNDAHEYVCITIIEWNTDMCCIAVVVIVIANYSAPLHCAAWRRFLFILLSSHSRLLFGSV